MRKTVKPYVHSFPLSAEDINTMKRETMRIFGLIVRRPSPELRALRFEEAYRNCYNLVLHKHSEDLLRMLRLSARAAVRNLLPDEAKRACVQLKDVVGFYARAAPVSARQRDVTALFNEALLERESWARAVLGRAPALWREYYLRPGGRFEARRAPQWHARAKIMTLDALVADADARTPRKRARRCASTRE